MSSLRTPRSRRPGLATLIASLALFVALGGSALAAGVIITSNAQVGRSTIAGGRDGLTLGGKVDNIVDGTVANADLGRKSVSEDKLAPGIAGPHASGRVRADGAVVQVTGQPVVERLSGQQGYCVSVPGRSTATSSIVVSPDQEFDTTRTTGSQAAVLAVVEPDGACGGVLADGNGFRVRTASLDLSNGSMVPRDEGFTFLVS
jgi:hypothetical protein